MSYIINIIYYAMREIIRHIHTHSQDYNFFFFPFFENLFQKCAFKSPEIIFDSESFSCLKQFGGSKAQSGGAIARRNEFQDKFFLVHSTCRWRDCARARQSAHFLSCLPFRNNERKSDFRIPLSGNILRTGKYGTERRITRRRVVSLFGHRVIQDLPVSLNHADYLPPLPAFFRPQPRCTQAIRFPYSRNTTQWILRFQMLARYKITNLLSFPLFINCVYIL